MIFSVLFLAFCLGLFNHFVSFVEARPGVILDDPVIKHLPSINLQWLTFFLIYGSILLAVVVGLRQRPFLKYVVQGYGWLLIMRMAVMFVVPLEAPPGMIILRDPLVELFGSDRVLTKDLFFSGHTATLALLFFFTRHFSSNNKAAQKTHYAFFVSTVLVAGCVLIQHVHYTIDVVVAPLFSWAAFRFTLCLNSKWGVG